MAETDILTPEYWEDLERTARLGKELILVYGGEKDPTKNHEEPSNYEELMAIAPGNNPYGYIGDQLTSEISNQESLEYFGFEELTEVSEIIVILSEKGGPHQSIIGENGSERPVQSSLKTKVEELTEFVDLTLGETDEEGVDMSYGDAKKAQQNMLEEAAAIERIFGKTITRI